MNLTTVTVVPSEVTVGLAGLEGLPVVDDRIIQMTQQCFLEVAKIVLSMHIILSTIYYVHAYLLKASMRFDV